MSTTTLDKRIAAALASDTTSADVAVMIAEVDAAILTAIDAAERERIRSYDPTIVDAQKARQSRADAEFVRDRLQAALAALQMRLQELQAQEFLAQWRADYEGLKVERDALAAQLREVYPPYATKIAELFARIAVNDEALSRLHQARPAGVALHLLGAELVARGLDGFTRFEPSIASELKLPDWNQATKLAWPPPTPSIAVQVAADMARMLPPHAGANWHEKRETREAADPRKRKQGSR